LYLLWTVFCVRRCSKICGVRTVTGRPAGTAPYGVGGSGPSDRILKPVSGSREACEQAARVRRRVGAYMLKER